jgi:hypothetical protein
MCAPDISSVQQVFKRGLGDAQAFTVKTISSVSTKTVMVEFAQTTTLAKSQQAP